VSAAKHPRLSVELDTSNARRDLVQEGFDFGVRVGPTADADFVTRRLWSGQFALFATRAVAKEAKEDAISCDRAAFAGSSTS
jgi:DNA-binding transcriptional LysR family regulator